jgi:Flp pilus assembly protein TadG
LVFSSQKGAVTAEFMLLFPTVVLALAGILGVFQLGLAQLQLSREAFSQARHLAIGNELGERLGSTFEVSEEGKWVCVTATKQLLLELEARACLIRHGL